MTETTSSGASSPRSFPSVNRIYVSPGVLHPFYLNVKDPTLYSNYNPLPEKYSRISPFITSLLFNLSYLARRIVCASNSFVPGVSYGPLPLVVCEETVMGQLQMPDAPVFLFLGLLADKQPDWEETKLARRAAEVGQKSAEWLQETLARARDPLQPNDFAWDSLDLARLQGNFLPTPNSESSPQLSEIDLSGGGLLDFQGGFDTPSGSERLGLNAGDEADDWSSRPSMDAPHHEISPNHGSGPVHHVLSETFRCRNVGTQTALDESGEDALDPIQGHLVRDGSYMVDQQSHRDVTVGRTLEGRSVLGLTEEEDGVTDSRRDL